MIELAQAQVTLSGPLSHFFDFVTNMENYGEWFPGVIAVKSANDLPPSQIGKTYAETLNFPEGEFSLKLTVVECELNRIFVTQGDLVGLLPQMTMKFIPLDEAQFRFDLSYHSRNDELEKNQEMLHSLKRDIQNRANTAMDKLAELFI